MSVRKLDQEVSTLHDFMLLVVTITVRHVELPETNTNIYICQSRIHLSTKIIRQHMLYLSLVTYDNIVMCFTLYLHFSKRDFI
jgi:hypothetical protein